MRLVDADVVMDRVDVLGVREPLTAGALGDPNLELAQYVKAGLPVTARAVRERPVIRRGALVEANMSDGLLSITLKVEALEDAFLGQSFRVRNPQNRREYLAQVKDDRTVYLLL
jgi:flagella basal body P-ring formation protein FlgA